MKPTFDKTVDILVKAYLNGTLAHKLCTACAVGNLVAHAKGTRPKALETTLFHTTEFDCFQYENGDHAEWWGAMNGSYPEDSQFFKEGIKQIESTGYSIDEIRMIEDAFESAPGDPSMNREMFLGRCTDPEWMFNGLMAVVDILAEIHGIDLTAKEEAKKLFTKPEPI